MNYFIILMIFALGGAGYYECTVLQQQSDEDRRQLNNLGAKVDALQLENKKFQNDKAQLTKSVDNAQSEIADLTKQSHTVQSTLAEAHKQPLQAQNAKKPEPPPSNSLGTIATLDGKTFQNCQLLKVEADGIVITYSEGISKILYSLMPPAMQKRYGYDSQKAAELTEAQIHSQEEQRQAAAQIAGK